MNTLQYYYKHGPNIRPRSREGSSLDLGLTGRADVEVELFETGGRVKLFRIHGGFLFKSFCARR